MKRPSRHPSLHDQSGVVALEFALVAPLFIGLIFLLTDFARFFNYLNDSNQVAAYGARMAAVNAYPGASTLRSKLDTSELRNAAGGAHLPGGVSLCVKYASNAKAGDPVTVKATGTFKLVPLIGGTSIPMHAEATMRLERTPTYASDAGC